MLLSSSLSSADSKFSICFFTSSSLFSSASSPATDLKWRWRIILHLPYINNHKEKPVKLFSSCEIEVPNHHQRWLNSIHDLNGQKISCDLRVISPLYRLSLNTCLSLQISTWKIGSEWFYYNYFEMWKVSTSEVLNERLQYWYYCSLFLWNNTTSYHLHSAPVN